ncbi:MAG: hypothetical protein MI921_17370 [Cytophagales bacterium]|nr:hypothetical protein [Cytophagales bacterium]
MKTNSIYNHLHYTSSSDKDASVCYQGSKIKHDKQAWKPFKSGDPEAFSYAFLEVPRATRV